MGGPGSGRSRLDETVIIEECYALSAAQLLHLFEQNNACTLRFPNWFLFETERWVCETVVREYSVDSIGTMFGIHHAIATTRGWLRTPEQIFPVVIQNIANGARQVMFECQGREDSDVPCDRRVRSLYITPSAPHFFACCVCHGLRYSSQTKAEENASSQKEFSQLLQSMVTCGLNVFAETKPISKLRRAMSLVSRHPAARLSGRDWVADFEQTFPILRKFMDGYDDGQPLPIELCDIPEIKQWDNSPEVWDLVAEKQSAFADRFRNKQSARSK